MGSGTKVVFVAILTLIVGCGACAPKQTLRLTTVEQNDSIRVWYSPIAMNNMLKWHQFTRDSTGTRIEMAFCVYGYREKGMLYVLKTIMASVGEQTHENVYNIMLGVCEPEGLIGWGHTHPSTECRMSRTDMETAVSLPFEYSFVVCLGRSEDEIGVSFYSRRSILRGLQNAPPPHPDSAHRPTPDGLGRVATHLLPTFPVEVAWPGNSRWNSLAGPSSSRFLRSRWSSASSSISASWG